MYWSKFTIVVWETLALSMDVPLDQIWAKMVWSFIYTWNVLQFLSFHKRREILLCIWLMGTVDCYAPMSLSENTVSLIS